MTNKELLKMEQKIIFICRKGKGAIHEYKSYIDDIVDSGKYFLLQDLLFRKWNIDYRSYSTVEELKNGTFEKIKRYVPTTEQEQIQRIYDTRGVYQIGAEIFDNIDNNLLGQIKESEYIYDNNEYYSDKELMEKKHLLVKYLIVTKGPTELKYDDPETDLIEKYRNAVNYLLL